MSIFCDYADWGLGSELKEDGSPKRLWLPHGLTVPYFSDKGEVMKINIRRLDWYDGDKLGKYIKVKGSMKAPAIYGDINKRVAIVLLDVPVFQKNVCKIILGMDMVVPILTINNNTFRYADRHIRIRKTIYRIA